MSTNKKVKQDKLIVAVRIKRVDFIATLFKLIITTIISSIIATLAFGTAYVIAIINDGKNDLQAVLVIMACTIIWLVLLIKILTTEKELEAVEAQIDNKGNIGIKHKNTIIRFNIVNEYKKKNLKIHSDSSKSYIIVYIPRLNKQYSIKIIDSNEFKSKILDIVSKNNIVISIRQEE